MTASRREAGKGSSARRSGSQTKPDTALASSATDDVLLSIRGLKTYYSIRGSFGARLIGREAGSVKAVDDISLDLHKGEVLGLVGESGSGKTTLGRTLLGPRQGDGGSVMFEGRDITHVSPSASCGSTVGRCRSCSRIRMHRSTRP